MSRYEPDGWGTRTAKAVLTIGFVALAGGVALARATPARRYELSIYAATPVEFWLAVALAAAVGIAVASGSGGRLRSLAVVLAGLAFLSVVVLPLVRGYYLYGGMDSLTHLGWVKDIESGVLAPSNLRYPGIHLLAVVSSQVAGVSLRRGLMFVPPTFVLLYFLFVPLTVREITGGAGQPLVVGGLSAFLLLPITNISTHLNPHPISQSILLSPLMFYLAFRYVEYSPDSGTDSGWPSPSAFGTLLASTSIAIVLYHPQQAVALLAILVVFSLIQLVYRWKWSDRLLGRHRPLHGQTAFFAAVTFLWTFPRPGIRNVVERRFTEMQRFLLHPQTTPAGRSVQSRSNSLTEIGGSVPELFAKLFVVDTIFVILAVWLVVVAFANVSDNRSLKTKTTYLAVGIAPIAIFFALFFVGFESSADYFRYYGLLMVIATVLGAVIITYWFANGKAAIRSALAVGFMCMSLLAVLVVFSSPYIYLPSDHVSQMQMEGHEAAFEHRAENVTFVGIRSGPWRYGHAVDGTVGGVDAARYTGVSGDVLERGIETHYEADRYVIVTRRDRRRELGAYRGLRYSRESFRALEDRPGVHRVQSNGEFTLYYGDFE